MADIEIGMGKSARRAHALDDIAIVPSRRTRDTERVDLGWDIDAFRFEAPVLAAPSDAVCSPATAADAGRARGGGDPPRRGPLGPPRRPDGAAGRPGRRRSRRRRRGRSRGCATRTRRTVRPELVEARIAEIKASGVDLRRRRLAERGRRTHEAPAQGRARPARHRRPARVGRARRPARRGAAQPQDVHPPVRAARPRRRVHQLPGGAAPHAHRRRRRHRALEPGARRRARHRLARWPPPSPTPERPACATSTRPACTATSSPRAASAPAATSPRPSPAAPTPSCSTRCSPAPPTRRATAGGGTTASPTRRSRSVRCGTSGRRGAAAAAAAGRTRAAEPARRPAQGDGADGYESVKELQKAELVVTAGESRRSWRPTSTPSSSSTSAPSTRS